MCFAEAAVVLKHFIRKSGSVWSFARQQSQLSFSQSFMPAGTCKLASERDNRHCMFKVHFTDCLIVFLQVEALNSCPLDMPLLQEEAGVLEQSKLAELQASLRNSTWLMPLGRRTGILPS